MRLQEVSRWHWTVLVVALVLIGVVVLQNSEFSYLRGNAQVLVSPPLHGLDPSALSADDGARLRQLEDETAALKDIINNKRFGWGDCLKMMHRKNCVDVHRDDPSVLPCRAEVMYDMILAMDEALTEAGVIHWYAFGTLLGARRNRTVIPWTADADLVYMRENRTQCDYRADVVAKVQYKLYTKGIVTFLETNKRYDPIGFGRACIASHNVKYRPYRNKEATNSFYMNGYPSLDLFAAKAVKDIPEMIWVWPAGGCRFRLSHSLPVTKIDFYNTTITAPFDVNKTLVATYGMTYMLPPPKLSGHGDRSYECDKTYNYLPGME